MIFDACRDSCGARELGCRIFECTQVVCHIVQTMIKLLSHPRERSSTEIGEIRGEVGALCYRMAQRDKIGPLAIRPEESSRDPERPKRGTRWRRTVLSSICTDAAFNSPLARSPDGSLGCRCPNGHNGATSPRLGQVCHVAFETLVGEDAT
jgi:hypothetical protein